MVKIILRFPRGIIRTSQYIFRPEPFAPPIPPTARTAGLGIATYISEYSVLVIPHRPGARLVVVAYGSGVVRVGDTVVSVVPEGVRTVVRGSRVGLTVIRAEPLGVLYLEVYVMD